MIVDLKNSIVFNVFMYIVCTLLYGEARDNFPQCG